MLVSVVIVIAVFIIIFDWFPVDMWQPWTMFFACFGISFIGSCFVMVIKEKVENRKMKEALDRLKEKGEIFGLLGPSGAGKTTLIKILTGQLRQNDGYAEILGKDTKTLGELEHKQIGTMMDNFGLYERLSLARALMNNANLLFLDEPTTGLDPVTAREMHRILLEQREKGTTIFLTTHNMFEAESLCCNVALLSEGSIIEYGKPTDICKKYNHLNKLRITLKNGEEVTLENGSASAQKIKDYLEKNMIRAIHSTEPTLETVFIELTGKGLD